MDQDALSRFHTHHGSRDSAHPADPDPHLEPFIADRTERDPPFEALPEEEWGNSPWTSEFKVCGDQALIALSGHERANAVDFIRDPAEINAPVCFDPKIRSILAASPELHVEHRADKAVWPLTLATLSLALAGILWLHWYRQMTRAACYRIAPKAHGKAGQ